MRISFVIPAFNEEKLLGSSLASIREAAQAFLRRGWSSEVIVCDNNSSDRTAAIAREAGATVVFEPINQIARARNSGAAAAQGDWLVFIDADSRPSEPLLDDVADAIQSGRCLAGGATVRLEGVNHFIRFWNGAWNVLSRSLRWVAGSFIFCETPAFRALGGFNEELFVAEELDLSRRLKRLARQQQRRIVILHQHPLLTSARKLELYSARELAWFLARSMLSAGRNHRRRDACHPWYDGRR